jgi:hypothetical protein
MVGRTDDICLSHEFAVERMGSSCLVGSGLWVLQSTWLIKGSKQPLFNWLLQPFDSELAATACGRLRTSHCLTTPCHHDLLVGSMVASEMQDGV